MPWFENVDSVKTEKVKAEKGPRSRRPWVGGLMALVVVCAAIGFVVAHSLSSSPATAPPSTSPSTSTPSNRAGGGAGTGGRFAGRGTIGTIKAKASDGDSFTMTTTSNATVTVEVTSRTTYRLSTATSSFSSLSVGERVAVEGTTSGSIIRATTVLAIPNGGDTFAGRGFASGTFGSVVSVYRSTDSFTVKTFSGSSTTVDVSSRTTYGSLSAGDSGASSGTASFSSVVVGARVSVAGSKNAAGVVVATKVTIVPAGSFGGRGVGGGFGGFGGGAGNTGSTP